jgi:hypothetical protein
MAQANFNVPKINNILPKGITLQGISNTLKTVPSNSNNTFRVDLVIGDGDDEVFLKSNSQTNYYNHLGLQINRNNDKKHVRPRRSRLKLKNSGELFISRFEDHDGGNNNQINNINNQITYGPGRRVKEVNKIRHLSAYIRFLKDENDKDEGQGHMKQYIRTMIAMTYIAMLNRNIGQNNTHEKIYNALKNIVNHHNNLYGNDKIKNYRFYDFFVNSQIKNFTSALIDRLKQLLETNKFNNIENNENKLKFLKTYIILNRIADHNINKKIIEINKLKECISIYRNKLKPYFKEDDKFNTFVEKLKQQMSLTKEEANKLRIFRIRNYNNINSAIDKFQNLYKNKLENAKNNNELSNMLNNLYINELVKKGKFDVSKKHKFRNVVGAIKQDIIKSKMNKDISDLENISNQKEFEKKVRNLKLYYIGLKGIDSKAFYKFPSLFNESVRAIKGVSKQKYSNTSSNLKNLKNEYIKNIEQNGANSIPNNDELKKQFKNKPALLREILRKKRTKGSSAVSKIYKDEINYFKNTGKYRPLKAYENNILLGMKNIKGKKKIIENKIQKLEKQKNNKSVKNEKNKINKEISELKNELKKINEKIYNKEKEVKGGLMNKSKGINIDKEVDYIRRKYQRELMALGKKHLEELWKSYYSSLTNKNSKYENSKINANYTKSKKELQKNFGNGFINTYSSPIYKQLATYKKYVERRMRKLRADVAKAKSPRKIKVVRRVK